MTPRKLTRAELYGKKRETTLVPQHRVIETRLSRLLKNVISVSRRISKNQLDGHSK
jgi:hypothetical protein